MSGATVFGATYTVTSTTDNGDPGTLRWAIGQANGDAGSTIVFAAGLGPVTLASALPMITAAVTIDGGNGQIISGGGTHRIFFVNTQSAADAVNLSNLNLADGFAKGGDGGLSGGGGMGAGGAIFVNTGAVSVANVAFSGNGVQGGKGGDGAPKSVYSSWEPASGGGGGLGGNGGTGNIYAGGGGGGYAGNGGSTTSLSGAGGGGGMVGDGGGPTSGAGGAGGGPNGGAGGVYDGGGGFGTHVNGKPGGSGGGGGGGYYTGYGSMGGNGGDFGGGGGSTISANGEAGLAGNGGDFGGGGGAAGAGSRSGDGGYGGGGGGGYSAWPGASGGNGGFGGGGGGSSVNTLSGGGAYGGRGGAYTLEGHQPDVAGSAAGGGGAGLGGAIFVRSDHGASLQFLSGSETSSTATGGLAGTSLPPGVHTSLAEATNGLGAGAAIFLSSGTTKFQSGTLVSSIAGDGSAIQKTTSGVLVLSGSNTFNGGLDIAMGTVQIGNGGTFGSIASDVAIAATGTLVFQSSNALAYSRIVSGEGRLVQAGSGTLTLTGNNTHTGSTTVSGGTLRIGDGGATGSVISDIVNHAAVVFDRSNTLTYGGVLSGTGSVRFTGGGTFTLSGQSDYTGGTTIGGNATVVLGNSLALGVGGNLVIESGGLLTNGTAVSLDHKVTANGSFTLGRQLTLERDISLGADITITSANLTGGLASTSTIAGNISGGHHLTFSEGTNGTGVIVLSGSNSHTGGTTFAGGTIRLDSAEALGSVGTLSFTGGTLLYTAANHTDYSTRFNRDGGQQFRLDTNGHDVVIGDVLAGGGSSLHKFGEGSLTITSFNSYDAGTYLEGGTINVNNNIALGYGRITARNGAIRAINDARTLDNAITLDGTLEVGRLTNFTGDVTVSSPSTISTNNPDGPANANSVFSGVISGPSSITIQEGLGGIGTGAIVFSGNNTYEGGTFLKGGRLAISNSANLGVGEVVFDGGTLRTDANVTFVHSLRTAGAGTLDTNGHTVSLSELHGNGSFTAIGGGQVNIAGNSIYAGVLSVGASSLHINSGATLQIGSGGTTGSLTGNVSADGILAFDRAGDSTFAGNVTGAGTFVKTGPGKLTLTGNNQLSGGYVLQSGIVSLGSTGALGNSGFLHFDGGTLQYTASNTTSYAERFSNEPGQQYRLDTNGQHITQIAGLHSTTGSLTKLGTGTLTLAAENTYTGGTTIQAGTLALAHAGALSTSGTISFTGGTLQFSAANTTDYSARFANTSGQVYGIDTNGQNVNFASRVASPSGSLTKIGSGTLTFSGTTDNTALAVVVNQGVVVLGKTSATGVHAIGGGAPAANLIVNSGGTARLGGTGSDQIYFGATVQVNAGGALDLNGRSEGFAKLDGTGGVRNSAASTTGTLTLEEDNATSTLNVQLSNGDGTLALAKVGSGTLGLSGSNSYSGGTTLIAGTIIAAHNQAAGTGIVTVDGGVFIVETGVTVANEVHLSGGSFRRVLGAGSNLAGAVNASSAFDGGNPDTTAKILQGTLISSGTLDASFHESSTALNDVIRLSDVYSLNGTGTNIFVMQLSIDDLDSGSFLAWHNEATGLWVNAVEGNTGGATFFAGDGAYNPLTDFHLGTYGVDTVNGTVWAVLNHNSEFAIIPEPGVGALLMLGLGALLFRDRCRTQKRSGRLSA